MYRAIRSQFNYGVKYAFYVGLILISGIIDSMGWRGWVIEQNTGRTKSSYVVPGFEPLDCPFNTESI